jgi:hypothetical protein
VRHAAAFDRLYGAGGWVEMGLYSLHRNRWDPWAQESESHQTHHMVWPARYQGDVWVKIKPLPEHIDEDHCITVLWGTHRAAQDYRVPAEGLVLVTGGGPHHIDEGVHRFILNSDLPVHALFGAWDLPEEGRACNIDRALKQRPRARRPST